MKRTIYRQKSRFILPLLGLALVAAAVINATFGFSDVRAVDPGTIPPGLQWGVGGHSGATCTTPTCYGKTAGASWIKVTITDDHTGIATLPNFNNWLPGSSSYITNCKQYGAAYVYGYNLIYADGTYSGQWNGAAQWNTHVGRNYRPVVAGAVSEEEAREQFEYGYSINANGNAGWDVGSFGWFCAYKDGAPEWKSKTNVYDPKANKTVSSDFIDYQTDEHLEIPGKAGEEVEVRFNSYLKASKKDAETQFYVKHSVTTEGNVGNVTYNGGQALSTFNNNNFIPKSDYKAPDENEHSMEDYKGAEKVYKLKIPAEAEAGAKITLCESIFYKKHKKDDPDETINQYGTHACADIIIDASLWQSKTNVHNPDFGTVSSGFNDGRTDETLNITVEAGQSVMVYMNSYLKSSKNETASTKFHVEHTVSTSGNVSGATIDGAAVSAFNKPNYIPEQVFTAHDALEHSVHEATGSSTAYEVYIPDTATNGSTIKMCERIYYKKRGVDDPNPDKETHACAIITVNKQTTIPPTFVSCSSASTSMSVYADQTYGESRVKNYSASTYNSWREEVIGKPGDTIQYCHSLAFPNRYVGTGLTGAHSVDKAQSFEIYGSRDGTKNTRYSFPDATASRTDLNPDMNKFRGWTIPADNNDPHPMGTSTLINNTATLGESNGVQTGSYSFVLYSPFDNPGYNCAHSSFTSNEYKMNGFKIPGFTVGTCSAAAKTQNTTEAGHKISQSLKFDDLKGWVMWKHTITGSCGCDDNSKVITNYGAAYDYYTAIGYPGNWGKSSHTGSVCEESGCCCSSFTCGPYGDQCCCDLTNYSDPHTDTFPDMWKNYGTVIKTATAYVPYNYNTEVHSKSDQGVKFLGDSINISGTWQILTRNNTVASPDMPNYATHTPLSAKFRVYELLFKEEYSGTIEGNNNSSTDVCQYFSGAAKCNLVHTQHGEDNDGKGFNKHGQYSGGGKKGTPTFNRQIPDDEEYVGWKYCVGTSFWPASSHDTAANDWANNTSGAAFSDSGNNKYNISGLSCVTIAKKPNFQVWGAGLFTKGSVNTSVSKKYVSSEFGNAYGATGTPRMYGSWSEYSIIAGGNVNGMASGAALGYEAGYGFNLPTGGASLTANMSAGSLSPETIANTGTSAGSSGIGGLNSTVLSRLKARYREKAVQFGSTDPGRIVQDDDTGAQYLYTTGDFSVSSILSTITHRTTNKSKYTGLNTTAAYGALTKGVINSPDFYSADNTLVIYVRGKLTIDRNICYSISSGECNNGKPAQLSSYSLTTNSISALPQILIFAQDITINDNVDRVEAWLVLDEGSGGELKTCQYSSPNFHLCNKTLVITGPVFAKSLVLPRTAGANHGIGSGSGNPLNRNLGTSASYGGNYIAEDGSIAPAEIFNLRPDAYFWAYNQAQRSTEAVTTYARELAPRY